MFDMLADEATDAKRLRVLELHRPVDALIRSIYTGKVAWSALSGAYQQKLRYAYATVNEDSGAADAWNRLLNHVGHRSPLLTVEPVVPYLGPQPGNTFVDSLLLLALRHEQWRCNLDDWWPVSDTPREQFGALVRYLFTEFYVPQFMDAAWFEGFSAYGEQHRNWFVHIGCGHNLRTADLPVSLTKMASHCFLQASHDAAIVGALRYGQTLALGGDETLAAAIAESRLGSILPDEPFWASVIHFFVNNPRMNCGDVAPIVDFIYHHRFGATTAPLARPEFSDAAEPDFTMRGRTLAALLKRVAEWHDVLAKAGKKPKTVWEPCGIEPYYVEQRDEYGTLNAWTILELTTNMALHEEGCEMRHCVRTYSDPCLRGQTAIWSLRIRSGAERRNRRLLTIEVNLQRRAIVQVRGRCNKTLSSFRGKGRMKAAGEILRRWARERRLSIACSL